MFLQFSVEAASAADAVRFSKIELMQCSYFSVRGFFARCLVLAALYVSTCIRLISSSTLYPFLPYLLRLFLSLSLSLSHTHTHTHTLTHACMHAHAHTHARMHTHTHFLPPSLTLALSQLIPPSFQLSSRSHILTKTALLSFPHLKNVFIFFLFNPWVKVHTPIASAYGKGRFHHFNTSRREWARKVFSTAILVVNIAAAALPCLVLVCICTTLFFSVCCMDVVFDQPCLECCLTIKQCTLLCREAFVFLLVP